MRESKRASPLSPGPSVSTFRRSVGDVDRVHQRTVGAHDDQRGNDVGAWLSEALALRMGYRGQWTIAAIGATGAATLIVARWIGG